MQLLIIDKQLCDLNTFINAQRINRYYGASKKKIATEKVIEACRLSDIKPIEERSMFNFIWFVPNRRKDPDNVAFGCKFIFDGLVKSGLLPNDNMKYVGEINHQFHIDKENPRVEIVIHPVD